MGFYARRIFPYLLDWSMGLRITTPYRERIVGRAAGEVLEVGIGSGVNLPFYRPGVSRLLGVDPSPELLGMASRKDGAAPAGLLRATAEKLPLADESVEAIVMTWTLCSVLDPAPVLAELHRVLKPGGALHFVEHGRAPDPGVARWQARLNPLWRPLACGCNLDREPDRLIREAGFSIENFEAGYAPGPRFVTFFYEGTAVKP